MLTVSCPHIPSSSLLNLAVFVLNVANCDFEYLSASAKHL